MGRHSVRSGQGPLDFQLRVSDALMHGTSVIDLHHRHSGSGFQSSWGSADEALRLLQAALGAN